MRLSVASAAAAAVVLIASVDASPAPALAQDFSITNQAAPPVQGHRNLMRQLQAWWDVHASYPEDAAAADEGGTVKIHLIVHPDGNIAPVDVVQGSGSCALDTAGSALFRGAFIHPFPADEAQQPVAMDLSLHYVLTHRHNQTTPVADVPEASRGAFTISNDPVKSTVVESLKLRSCTGLRVAHGIRNHPNYGAPNSVKITFFRSSNDIPMAKLEDQGMTVYSPVIVQGQVLNFMGTPYNYSQGEQNHMRFTVWPDGDNHLIGDTAFGKESPGTLDLTCSSVAGPPIASPATWVNMPKFATGVAIPPASTCRK